MDELEKKREGDDYSTADEFLVHTAVHNVKGHNNVYEGMLVYISMRMSSIYLLIGVLCIWL